MRLAAFATILSLIAVPAVAQDDALPLVAKLFKGLADGATVRVDGLGTSTVKATGPGTFEVQYERGLVTHMVGNPAPCVFTYESKLGTSSSGIVQVDLNKLRDVRVVTFGEQDGLFNVEVDFRGPDIMHAVAADGSLTPIVPPASFATSNFTVAELEEAGKALLAICHA